MTALILHPNQELNLISLQNDLYNTINPCWDNSKGKIFKLYPLWLPLDISSDEKNKENPSTSGKNKKNELKTIADKIEYVEITNFFVKDNQFFLEGKVSLKNQKVYSSFLPLLICEPKECLKNANFFENWFEQAKALTNEKLPLKIKIFRLADVSKNGNTYAVEDFIWKKLK